METVVFLISAVIVLGGAIGVIVARNPVHAALSLVATLFGIAVLFVAKEAHLLAAVQVIVYTGAIVVLILFVLMLLGVDRDEDLATEPLVGQRFLAGVVGVAIVLIVGSVLLVPVLRDGEDSSVEESVVTGQRSVTAPLEREVLDPATGDPVAVVEEDDDPSNIRKIGQVIFTDYVVAFEITAALLTIAVVGAVVLARRPDRYQDLPPDPDPVIDPEDEEWEAGDSASETDADSEDDAEEVHG